MKKIRLVLAQLNFVVGDIEANCQQILAACKTAIDAHQADIIIFPELALTGYPPEDLLLRPELYDRCDRALSHIEKASQDITIILGCPLREGKHIYNSALIYDQGKRIAVYHKQALPNYSVFDEKRYFTAGHEPLVVDLHGVPMGITVCEDIWVDAPVQRAVQAGARCIININASPYHIGKVQEREQLVQHHTKKYQIPLVYTNLVGGQDELVFDGHSFAYDGAGQLVFRAPEFTEGLYPLDLSFTNNLISIPRQQCNELHSENENIYQALVTGVRDYVRKNGFDGAVIGLSGGIDSAVTLAIAVDALGAENVEAVSMPSRFTADMSVQDAKVQCENMGVVCHVISIEPMFESFMLQLKELFADLPRDTTEENIQARCRGVLLMAISNKKRKIVLTTGNKSEMAVGYATLYGDMAGGFDVLKDVIKTRVYTLARWRNTQSPVIPQRVIDRPPSAELAPDQKDSDSLPDYAILDDILVRYIEQDQDLLTIVQAGHDEQIVSRVMRMVDTTEYKRRQAAPGVRITQRAFGRDRRYPLTHGFHHGRKRILGSDNDKNDEK